MNNPDGSEDRPETRLKIGEVRDQTELSSVLETLYEAHYTLFSVEMLEGGK